jgi:hypothetical protein
VQLNPAFVLAVTLAAGCSSRNPVLVVPPSIAPLTLSGVVWSHESGRPIVGARVLLAVLSPTRNHGTLPEQTTDTSGSFRFKDLLPGRYLLLGRAIGYKVRRDTIVLAAAPGLELRYALLEDHYCLDVCAPDPRAVAAAEAARSRWRCDRERASVDFARENWVMFFLPAEVQEEFGFHADSATIARQLRRVTKDETCRRIADARRDATSLAFTVFRFRQYWLVSEARFHEPWVMTEQLKRVRYAGFLP